MPCLAYCACVHRLRGGDHCVISINMYDRCHRMLSPMGVDQYTGDTFIRVNSIHGLHGTAADIKTCTLRRQVQKSWAAQ